ncbi:MAG TPA: hypothetical protein VFA12_16470 [Stellaceae bacterium]|nr:hypothetical protein [Stellaceae bacterium]
MLAGSVVLCVLFCEFVMFRLVWVASDAPANAFLDGVVRYAPNQQGVWRVRDEIAAPYAINRQGWNSGVGDYAVERRAGVPRVALVGDSFVEALQVPHDRSLGERLAHDLASNGRPVQVYRFAISGAPLSQDLQMTEHEVARYRPDWLVVVMTDLDFDNSYRFQPGRYTSSFLKLRVADGRVAGEVPPVPWHADWREWLRMTATSRYFLYRWRVRPEGLVGWLLPHAEAAGLDEALPDAANVAAATDYLFRRMAEAARGIEARLLLVMVQNSAMIYAGRDGAQAPLNRLAAAIAKKDDVAFLDLDSAFAADWQAEHRHFEFVSDHHWNEHGHIVAADAIAAALQRTGWP